MMISTCSRDEVPDSDGDERPVDRRQAGHLGQSLQRTCLGVCPCGGSTLLGYICPCGGGGLTWWGGQQDGNKNVFLLIMVMSHHCRHQFPGRLMRLQNWTQEGTAVAFFKIFQTVTPSSTVLPTSQGKRLQNIISINNNKS